MLMSVGSTVVTGSQRLLAVISTEAADMFELLASGALLFHQFHIGDLLVFGFNVVSGFGFLSF